MQNQIVGNDDRNNWNELQGNFCHVIAVRGEIPFREDELMCM
jgi:hypothetical protein